MKLKLAIPIIIATLLTQINPHMVYALIHDDGYTSPSFQVVNNSNLKNPYLKNITQDLNYNLTIEAIDENGIPIPELPVYIDNNIFHTDASGKIIRTVNSGFHLIEAIESLKLDSTEISFIKWLDDLLIPRRTINITGDTTLQLIYNVKHKIVLYFYNWHNNKIITPSLVQLKHNNKILNISTNNMWLNNGNYTVVKVLFKDINVVKPEKYNFKITSPKVLKIICRVADMNITLLDSNNNPITDYNLKLVASKEVKFNLKTDSIGQVMISDMPFGEYNVIIKLGNQVITKAFLFGGEDLQLFFPVEFKREKPSTPSPTQTLTTSTLTMQNSNLINILVFILALILILDIVVYLYKGKGKTKQRS